MPAASGSATWLSFLQSCMWNACMCLLVAAADAEQHGAHTCAAGTALLADLHGGEVLHVLPDDRGVKWLRFAVVPVLRKLHEA